MEGMFQQRCTETHLNTGNLNTTPYKGPREQQSIQNKLKMMMMMMMVMLKMQITHLLQQKETSKCMLCVFVLQIDLRRV
jgi:ACR3 family arsenite efflux pump ArsB